MMVSCDYVQNNLSRYLDEELDENLRMEMEEHLKECSICSNEFKEFKELLAICKELPEEELPENFSMELHRRLSQSTQPVPQKKTVLFGSYSKIASAVAACLLLVFLLKGTFPFIRMGSTGNAKSAQSLTAADRNSTAGQTAENQENDGSAYKMAVPSDAGKDAVKKRAAGAEDSAVKGESSQTAKTEQVAILPEQKTTAALTKEDQTEEEVRLFDQPAGTMAAPASGYSAPTRRDVSFELNVADTDTSVKQVKQLAVEYSAEVAVGTHRGISVMSLAPSREKTASADSIVLNIKIQNKNYDALIERLKELYGTQSVIITSEKTTSLAENLDSCQLQINALDKKQAEMEKNGLNTEQKAQIQMEREVLQSQLEQLQSEAENSFIVVEVKKK